MTASFNGCSLCQLSGLVNPNNEIVKYLPTIKKRKKKKKSFRAFPSTCSDELANQFLLFSEQKRTNYVTFFFFNFRTKSM